MHFSLKKGLKCAAFTVLMGTNVVVLLSEISRYNTDQRSDEVVTNSERFANLIRKGKLVADKATKVSSLFFFESYGNATSGDDNKVSSLGSTTTGGDDEGNVSSFDNMTTGGDDDLSLFGNATIGGDKNNDDDVSLVGNATIISENDDDDDVLSVGNATISGENDDDDNLLSLGKATVSGDKNNDEYMSSFGNATSRGDNVEGDDVSSLRNLTTGVDMLSFGNTTTIGDEKYDLSSGGETVTNSTADGNYREWQMVVSRFRQRLMTLWQRCLEPTVKDVTRLSGTIPKLSYYSSKYNLFVCVSSKAGASTWKSHMLKMKGVTGFKLFIHLAQRHLKSKTRLPVPWSQTVNPSHSTARVISIRHPIDRLISAYVNQFKEERPVKYNSTRVDSKDNGTNLKSEQELQITFKQFLSAVILEKRKGTEHMYNQWKPQYRICNPCSLPYDYIIKLETFDADFKLLVNRLRIKELDINLMKNVSSSKRKNYEEYFQEIPPFMIREILDLYKYDFYLFGYEVPKFLEEMSQASSL